MGIKKIIGTSVLAVALIAGFLAFTGKASGLFRYIGADFRAEGQVQTVSTSSFELVTSGSTWPATIVVNSSTVFGGGYSTLTDVQAGDEVSVIADKSSGDFVASEVTKVPDPGTYGNTACDSFVLSTAVFERPINDYFYAVKDNMGIKINTDEDTQVVGGTFDDLLPGTEIIVEGFDCRTNGTLTAQTITIVNNEALEACNNHPAGSIVVRYRNVLLAHDQASAVSPLIPVDVPAGRYKVYGVSFDNHSTSPWDGDKNERWRVRGFNDGDKILTTKATKDLPDGIDFNETRIKNNVNLQEALDNIQLVHKGPIGSQGYQSVYPICVVFEPTTQGGGNEQAVLVPEDKED